MASVLSQHGPCLHDQKSAVQVREAHDEGRAEGRAEALVEAEAAAGQRLAALDQARREEREAAVREALALGVRRVRARPQACSPRHMPHAHLYNTRRAMPPSCGACPPGFLAQALARRCAPYAADEGAACRVLGRIASAAMQRLSMRPWRQGTDAATTDAATKAAEARLRAELEAQTRGAAAARPQAKKAANERDALLRAGAAPPAARPAEAPRRARRGARARRRAHAAHAAPGGPGRTAAPAPLPFYARADAVWPRVEAPGKATVARTGSKAEATTAGAAPAAAAAV